MADKYENYSVPGRAMMKGADYLDALETYMRLTNPVVDAAAEAAERAGQWSDDVWHEPGISKTGKMNWTKLGLFTLLPYHVLHAAQVMRPTNVLRTGATLFKNEE